MPQVSVREFEAVPLRVHEFLRGVPVHDVWAVDLPKPPTRVTLDAFLRQPNPNECASPGVDALMRLRLFLGRIFGLDQPPRGSTEMFADRLTPQDRAGTLVPPGKRYGPNGAFSVVYRFENEQLSELINRTAHAGALTALVENASSYRYFFAVYVRSVSRLTPVYMTLIDPFRKLIVYPALLRDVRADWERSIVANSREIA